MEVLPVLASSGDCRIVEVDGQPVITARDMARALGYSREDAISRLYKRNEASFTERDTFEIDLRRFNVNLTVNPQGGDPHVRVFAKRGALKICMKSNQPRAVQVQELLIDLFEQVERGNLVPAGHLGQLACRVDNLQARLEEISDFLRQNVTLIRSGQRMMGRQVITMAQEVRKLAEIRRHQEPAPILYLDGRRRRTSRSMSDPALQYITCLAREYPAESCARLVEMVRVKTEEEGWRIGSRATLYRYIRLAREQVGRRVAIREDAWISVKDAAMLLGVTEPTVNELIREGKIRAAQLGEGQVVVSAASLRAVRVK